MYIDKKKMKGVIKVITRRNISLSEELNRRLIQQAKKEDRKISAIVRRALREYFARHTAAPADPSPPAATGGDND